MEIPTDEESEDTSRALVPYNLNEAMKNLTIKKKLEDENQGA